MSAMKIGTSTGTGVNEVSMGADDGARTNDKVVESMEKGPAVDVHVDEPAAAKKALMRDVAASQQEVAPTRSRPSQLTLSYWKVSNRWICYMMAVLLFCTVGGVIIITLAVTKDEMEKVALGFLIAFAVIAFCVIPIACYTALNCIAMDGVRNGPA